MQRSVRNHIIWALRAGVLVECDLPHAARRTRSEYGLRTSLPEGPGLLSMCYWRPVRVAHNLGR